jgi:hypothetical protein
MNVEASVDPQCGGPDWTPITPKTGSLFHAETHHSAAALRNFNLAYARTELFADMMALFGDVLFSPESGHQTVGCNVHQVPIDGVIGRQLVDS